MNTLDKLTELIDSLPERSVTRINLIAVRGAMRVGEDEELRLHEVLRAFAIEATQRLSSH